MCQTKSTLAQRQQGLWTSAVEERTFLCLQNTHASAVRLRGRPRAVVARERLETPAADMGYVMGYGMARYDTGTGTGTGTDAGTGAEGVTGTVSTEGTAKDAVFRAVIVGGKAAAGLTEIEAEHPPPLLPPHYVSTPEVAPPARHTSYPRIAAGSAASARLLSLPRDESEGRAVLGLQPAAARVVGSCSVQLKMPLNASGCSRFSILPTQQASSSQDSASSKSGGTWRTWRR